MTHLFRAARQNRIFQDVVEQIQEAIIDGQLKVGDRLPSERDLKEMLQTSRSTLREALRVLEQKGLIEIKLGMGGGAVVKKVTSDLVAESLDLLIRSNQVSLKHIAEFRERVEGDVVRLATSRLTESDLDVLEKLLDDSRQCLARGVDGVPDFLSADQQVHQYFAKITGNPIYISLFKTMHDNIRRYFDELLFREESEMRENLQDLENVVAAMKKGDADTACRIVRTHVRRFNEYMEIREQQRKTG
jgi:GntR family transcriptional regulator, transcriptional repressor for pyruvate dehydrogenase complex